MSQEVKWIPAFGLVAEVEIASSLALLAMTDLIFDVIARPALQAVAISNLQSCLGQQALAQE
jgi:hypothetical protein